MEVLVREAPADLGPPQRRAVLAALAVDVGRPVPVEALVDRVWGADPPAGARRALYAHVARIRRLAERLDGSGEGRLPVLRRAGGYQLDLDPDRVDLHRFQRLAATARDRPRRRAARPHPCRAPARGARPVARRALRGTARDLARPDARDLAAAARGRRRTAR
ncbi:winged helix-turn-helix domain-containing protein [Streptomyces sp. NPDC001714]|uniref:AfsR/SARP family transcriptional regulator n=1 Tax=Streptomyces sp. NPDC001714 TaxID=3364603 RepID=UPI0036A741F6